MPGHGAARPDFTNRLPMDCSSTGWTFKGPRALWALRPGGDREPGALAMDIPLDLERRCEQRWAARFSYCFCDCTNSDQG